MASVNDLVLLDEEVISASINSRPATVEVGQTNFVAWLDVSGFSGASLTFTIQHSGNGNDFIDLASFPATTANGQQVLQVSNSSTHVLPHVRVSVASGGGGAGTATLKLYYDRFK